MKTLTAIVVFVALFASVAESKAGGAIKVSGFWSQDVTRDSTNAQDTVVFVVVQNVGAAPVTILAPIKNLVVIPNFDRSLSKFSAIAIFHVGFHRTVTGQLNIPSEVDVRPVRLLPTEVAEWRCNARLEGGVDPAKVSLSYEIEKGIADRFHAWSGSVEVPITRQPSGR